MMKFKNTDLLILMAWIVLLATVSNVILVSKNSSFDEQVELALLPVVLQFLILRYLYFKKDITNFYRFYSIFFFLAGLFYFIYSRFDTFHIPFLIQTICYLITAIILFWDPPEFNEINPKSNKFANRVLTVTWIISLSVYGSLNRTIQIKLLIVTETIAT